MNIKRIVLFPTQGFGNRIKAIVSAKILSEYLKIPLHINWINEKCINAEYRDIFSDEPNFLGDDIINKSSYFYNPGEHTETSLEKFIKNNITLDTFIIQGGHVFKHPEMDLITFLQKKMEVFQKIKWNKNILDKAERILKQKLKNNLNNLLGLHIRRFKEEYDEADNKYSNRFNQFKCSLKYYTDVIDRILKKNPSIQLFLSTNDKKVKQEIQDKYKNNIILNNHDTFDRNNKDDIVNSVVDFICLTRCNLIVGTYYSSFSDEACFMNMIPKYCVSDKRELLEYHTYGYDINLKFLIPSYNKIFKFF